MRLVIALILALLPVAARADAPLFSVEVLPLAKHYGTTTDYNFNKVLDGVALMIPLDSRDRLELIGLHYLNSFYIPTNVVGLSWMPLKYGPFHVGAMLGISNKNAYPYSPIKPIVGAGEVNVDLGPRTQLNIDVLPCGAGAWCSIAVAVGLRQAIGRR